MKGIIALLFLLATVASIKSAETPANAVALMMKKLAKYDSRLSQAQLNNAKAILEGCVQFTTDLRALAYVLSTAIGESNIQPISEYRASPGTYLYDVQNRYWGSGFYGRGYVQLTWDYNYRKFGELLKLNLLQEPNLALKPDIAGKIICLGMAKGLFTGVGLADYFTASNADWYNARRIVNGLDKASEFGDRASKIYSAQIFQNATPSPTPSPNPNSQQTSNGCKISRSAPVFNQCDSKWGSNTLGSSSTICKVGCLMSSVASALVSLGKTVGGQPATPGSLNAWLRSNGGYSGNMFVWGAMAPYGLKFLGWPESSEEIKKHICANRVVILNVNGGGHWVLATGYSGNTYQVMDPGYPKDSYPTSAVVCAGVFSL